MIKIIVVSMCKCSCVKSGEILTSINADQKKYVVSATQIPRTVLPSVTQFSEMVGDLTHVPNKRSTYT